MSRLHYILISLPVSGVGFVLSIQTAALGWLMSTEYHLNLGEIGIVAAAGPLAGMLGQLVAGRVSDYRYRRGLARSSAMLLAATVAALMLIALLNLKPIQALLHLGSITGIALLVTFMLDLAVNVGMVNGRAVIADHTRDGDSHSRAFAIMQTVSGAIGVLAYLISIMLGNLRLIYIGAAVVLLLTVLPLRYLNESSGRQQTGVPAAPLRPASGKLRMLYGAHSAAWLGIATMFIYLIGAVQQLGADGLPLSATQSSAVIGTALLIMNIIGFALPATMLAPLSGRFGASRVHAASMASMSLGFVLASQASTPANLYWAMLPIGVGWASLVSAPMAILSSRMPAANRAWQIGVLNLAVVIPQLFAAFALGPLLQQAADKRMLFWFCSVALAASSLMWFAYSGKNRDNA